MKIPKYFRANPAEDAILKAWSEKTGEKEAVFIRQAIREKAERDGVSKPASSSPQTSSSPHRA